MIAAARFRAGAVLLALALALMAGGCSPAPSPTPAPTPSPSLSPPAPPTPSRLPTSTPGGMTPAPVPEGFDVVAVPAAGISLPVPAAWETFDADDLADAATLADVVARYPGADRLLDAANQMGDRAVPALIALDPGAAGTDAELPPNVSVLVAQPAVGGPLLDFVAGFVSDGFEEAFGAAEPERDRVTTAIGEAVRLRFEIPVAGRDPDAATAWIVGAEAGTLLIVVLGAADEPPGSIPDALIEAAAPLP